jgi:hypothetical protein
MPAVSLYRRIGLAAVSGLLAYPLLRLDALFSASGNGTDSGWLMLHCAAFTLLVLLPLIGGSARRLFRTVVLLGGTVVVYYVALLMPDRVSIDWLGAPGPLIVTGVTGAMLTAILAWLAVPLRVAPRYWSLSMMAGILGGLVSYRALSFCDWTFGCSSVWQILPYSAGWLVWQVFMCFALNFGSKSD